MGNEITVKEWLEEGCKSKVFLKTSQHGFCEVGYIRNPDLDPWAVCPKLNAGFGLSFAVHYGTSLYVSGDWNLDEISEYEDYAQCHPWNQ